MRTATDTMNCLRAENLLPLFVAGDLTDERARDLLARHLRSCAPCARRADEYRESQNQLRLFAPPQFSEDFFQDIRQAVMSEIERQSALPGVFTFPWLWRWRRTTLALAASLALLLTSSTLALHFLWRRAQPQYAPLPVANLNSTTSQPTPAPQYDNLNAQGNHADAVAPTHALRNANVARVRRSAMRARRPTRAGIMPAQSSQARLTPLRPATFGETHGDGGESAPAGVTEPPMIRMEIQTSDPSIRIIWFAPRATE